MKSYGRPSGGVLGTLLDLRVEGERRAERALAAATEGRRAAEAEEGRLTAALAGARAAIAAARLDAGGELDGGLRAVEAQARRGYGARLEAQAGAAAEALAGHRANALARAIGADAAARAAHLRARQRREVVEKTIARRQAAARQQAARREETAADDLVRGARGAPRPPR